MKLVLVIQARTRSSRLPNKVLAPLCGEPLLARMIERVRLAREPNAIVVATTYESADDAIAALCDRLEVDCYRGHPIDCLDRHACIAIKTRADAVVKVPSDCPLIDPRVIDRVLAIYRRDAERYDYLGNLHPASWPDGNDVEVISARALATAACEASEAFDREHTTPYFWSQPERFRLGNVLWERGLDYSKRYRWVVDWREDLEAVRAIFEALLPRHGVGFSVDDVLALHAARPDLEAINAAHRGYDYAALRPRPDRTTVAALY